MCAMAFNKLAAKLTVAGEARRSWPAGGSLAYVDQGFASAHATCSGYALEMTEVCPGVSISYVFVKINFIFFFFFPAVHIWEITYDEDIDSPLWQHPQFSCK
jgi:hypothetical protein